VFWRGGECAVFLLPPPNPPPPPPPPPAARRPVARGEAVAARGATMDDAIAIRAAGVTRARWLLVYLH
jgi:hypothetical protein